MSDEALIHVIDDDRSVRDSLAFLLGTADFSVRTYESAAAFLEAAEATGPGCVVTDIRMPRMSGIDLLAHLREHHPALPVIVMTGHGDVPLAVEAMKAGAVEFLEKPFDDEVIIEAVRAAMRRGRETMQRAAEIGEIRRRLDDLSPREREVLAGLVAGHANKRIAHDLAISPRTVEIYRANVMTKMKVRSLSELVRLALLAGDPPAAESGA